jgi:uncharacterized membrane protein
MPLRRGGLIVDEFKSVIGTAGYAIEAVGVLVIIGGSILSSSAFALRLRTLSANAAYRDLRRDLARSIILGLEFLIAGDIVRTVVVSQTFESVATLALIILIRTFLSLTLHLEVEGRWPWQAPRPDEVL